VAGAGEFLKRRSVEVRTAGRYSLASRYDAAGKRREFACRTTRISPFQMLVSAPVLGPKGERVIAYFGEFGKLDGFITDIVDGGFLLDLAVSKSQREKLANKLEWIEKRQKDPTVVDVRDQQRIIPENPHTTLLFADETALTCFVIDVSPSGVAVSADIEPEIGTRLAVGRTVGTVIRRFDEGFAVKFDQLQDPTRLEDTIKPTNALMSAAALPREEPSTWYLD
jgi:hypothetical protein